MSGGQEVHLQGLPSDGLGGPYSGVRGGAGHKEVVPEEATSPVLSAAPKRHRKAAGPSSSRSKSKCKEPELQQLLMQ